MAWQKLGSTKLTSAGDTITVDGLTAKKHLMIQMHIIPSGFANARLRFNNDTGGNYADRKSDNGGADATGTSITSIRIGSNVSTDQYQLNTIYVSNIDGEEKLVISESVKTATGAGTAPDRQEGVSKYTGTSQITRVDIINTDSGDFDVDSEVTVYGTDSDSVGGDPLITNDIENNYIFEETDTGKHYLWSTTTSTWTEIA